MWCQCEPFSGIYPGAKQISCLQDQDGSILGMVLGIPRLYPTLTFLPEPKVFHFNFTGVLVEDGGGGFF